MPGTIRVSVLGLMDLPPSGESSSTSPSEGRLGSVVSLKIAMGQIEYQTGDKGDFSFPVTSLRKNLKLTLLGADGNVISQTDVKTMVVVEKRFWDALFPFEGGGCVHLKLQFILSAEEHKRIREMRETVLKRRHGELPKTNSRDSIAALNVTENYTTGFSAKFITEERHLTDQLSVKSQDRRGQRLVPSLSQNPLQQPEHHHEQDATHQSKANEEASSYQENQSNINENSVFLKGTMDPQLRYSESVISEETIATSSSPSGTAQEERKVVPIKESAHEKFPISNTKKLISAFENISSQEPRIYVGPAVETWMGRINRGVSSGAPCAEEMNTDKVTIRKMMPKPFSTGALPQMKLASSGVPYTEVQQEKHNEVVINKKNLRTNKQSIESKNTQTYEKLDPGNKKAVSEFLHVAESSSCERNNDTSEIIETKEVITFCRSADTVKNTDQYPSHEAKEGPLITYQHRHREDNVLEEKIGRGSFLDRVSFLGSEASYGNSDVTSSLSFGKGQNMLGYKDHLLHKINKVNDWSIESPRVCGEYPGGYLEPSNGTELVHSNEIRKDEEASTKDYMIFRKVDEPAITEQHSSSSMHLEQPKPCTVKAQSGVRSTRGNIYELTTWGSSDVKLDMLTYFDAEQCLLGSHGNSMPRHLCITSASKQLKNIIGGFISI